MNDYVRSLLRFWWVIVIGLAVAQAAAIMAVYNVDFSSMPPQLSERSKPKYSAEGRLLVGDQELSYLRTQVTRTVQPATAPGNEDVRTPIKITQAPDTATIIQAANTFPLLIEGDAVAKVRREQFGRLTGQVKAQAVYAVATPSRFTPSRVPVIQLIGVSDTPRHAIDLVRHTSTAFILWMTNTQKKGEIPVKDRITVAPVLTPETASPFGGASSTLPVLVFGVVLMAFVALAIFFDRIFPRAVPSPSAERARTEPEPARP